MPFPNCCLILMIPRYRMALSLSVEPEIYLCTLVRCQVPASDCQGLRIRPHHLTFIILPSAMTFLTSQIPSFILQGPDDCLLWSHPWTCLLRERPLMLLNFPSFCFSLHCTPGSPRENSIYKVLSGEMPQGEPPHPVSLQWSCLLGFVQYSSSSQYLQKCSQGNTRELHPTCFTPVELLIRPDPK